MNMKKRLLVHTCCGPCLTYPYRQLKVEYSVACLYYNPNIFPEAEYERRAGTFEAFCEANEIPYAMGEYRPSEYEDRIENKEMPYRCRECYRMRLEKTAKHAKQNGFESFTTTLLVSPYQDHEALREIGEHVGRTQEIEFLYKDFRTGFREGQNIAKEAGMYRQKYCGCKFSLRERDTKSMKKDKASSQVEETDTIPAKADIL